MTDHPQVASLVGATGLVGQALLQLLLSDERFGKVHILVRRSTGMTHAKLIEHIINFDAPQSWQSAVMGDVLFSTLGTTIKVAGSQAAQYRVDYTYQFEVAKAARQNGIGTYVLISSPWALPNSGIFYRRMKGVLERDTEALKFPCTRFVRPGPLYGDRQEARKGEGTAIAVLRTFSCLLPRVVRPNHALTVARAALAAEFDSTPGTICYEPDDVALLGKER